MILRRLLLILAILIVLTMVFLSLSKAFAADITGSGSTFVYPLMSKWAANYKAAGGGEVNYQSKGSGGGIKDIEQNTVTFGATDAPLSKVELEQNDLVQFPIVMGGIVPVVNLPGIAPGKIVLDGITLAKIFLGEITNWNDGRIKALNPNITLPDTAIAVVHRSDGSGTTFLFTDYLSKISLEWKNNVGAAKAVEWPAGIGAKGNEGVASMVKQTEGAIGYVEYAYAKQNHMTYTSMVNSDGKRVTPNTDTFACAAKNADWANTAGFGVILTNQSNASCTAWPIVGATFILVHKHPNDAAEVAAVKEALSFFLYAYMDGNAAAQNLDYVPIPEKLRKEILQAWKAEIDQSVFADTGPEPD